jgi:hypothetical protein
MSQQRGGKENARHIQITLRPHNHTRNLAKSAKVDDLIMHDLDHVERVLGCDGVDQDVAMYPDGIL